MSLLRKLILFVFCISMGSISAQNSITAYSLTAITNPNYTSTSSYNLHSAYNRYESRLAFSYGLRINKSTKINWIKYSAGLEWLDVGSAIHGLTFGDQIDDRRGFIYTTSGNCIGIEGERFLSLHDKYLSIPVLASFTKDLGEKWSIDAGLGASSDFYIRSRTAFIYKKDEGGYCRDSFTRQAGGSNKLLFSVLSEVGVNRYISTRFTGSVKLSYRKNLNATNINDHVQVNYMNYGFFGGVSYSLK